eukprot:CFRG2247T1
MDAGAAIKPNSSGTYTFHRELTNVFSKSPLDRLNNYRGQGGKFILSKQQDPMFMVLLFLDGKPLVRVIDNPGQCDSDKKHTELRWITGPQYDSLREDFGWPPRTEDTQSLCYLGEWNRPNGARSNQCFAQTVSGFSEEHLIDAIHSVSKEDFSVATDLLKFTNLRNVTVLKSVLTTEDAAVGAHAQALLQFHSSHKFCGTCGSKTDSFEGGSKRICSRNIRARAKYMVTETHNANEIKNASEETCKGEWFPRTDPVVICIVVDLKRQMCLLGRQSSWPKGLFSALAGFMEHGESIEDACRREIGEEAGIDIEIVRYHSSQPWPYPYSLMLGCIGIGDCTVPLNVDNEELEDARWFSREQLCELVEKGHTYKGQPSDDPNFHEQSKLTHMAVNAGLTKTKYMLPPSGAIAYQLCKGALEVWEEYENGTK